MAFIFKNSSIFEKQTPVLSGIMKGVFAKTLKGFRIFKN